MAQAQTIERMNSPEAEKRQEPTGPEVGQHSSQCEVDALGAEQGQGARGGVEGSVAALELVEV